MRSHVARGYLPSATIWQGCAGEETSYLPGMSIPACSIRHPRLWLVGVIVTANLALPLLGAFV